VGNSQLQHYLPQVYLKGFAAPSGQVWRYDRVDGSCKPLPPRVIGAEKNLYSIQDGAGVSQDIENEWFSRLDSSFGPILRKLERSATLSSAESFDLATFIAYLLIRTPAYIRETELRIRQFDTTVGTIGGAVQYHSEDDARHRPGDSFLLTKEESGEVSKARADAAERNDVLKVLMSSGMDFARVLLGLPWSLLSAPLGRSFIVGDSPFAIVPPRSHCMDLEGVGPMTPGAASFIPLSSTLCIRITNSGEAGMLQRSIDGTAVRAVNICQVMNSERYLFGPNEALVGKLTQAVNSRGLNRGVVITREAASVSDPDSSLLHSFTKSKIPPEWAERLPSD
jgi:hypothetical protein